MSYPLQFLLHAFTHTQTQSQSFPDPCTYKLLWFKYMTWLTTYLLSSLIFLTFSRFKERSIRQWMVKINTGFRTRKQEQNLAKQNLYRHDKVFTKISYTRTNTTETYAEVPQRFWFPPLRNIKRTQVGIPWARASR